MTNQIGPLAVGQDPTSSVILQGLRQLQVLPIRRTRALISADTAILPHILPLPLCLSAPHEPPPSLQVTGIMLTGPRAERAVGVCEFVELEAGKDLGDFRVGGGGGVTQTVLSWRDVLGRTLPEHRYTGLPLCHSLPSNWVTMHVT